MRLTKITIENYRLITNATIDVDEKTTLIVGRNNTAKTSVGAFIQTAATEKANIGYNDYPLAQRQVLRELLTQFAANEIEFDELCEKTPVVAIEFEVDYSAEGNDDNLGALSPFIIDVDENTTTALIRVEYKIKPDEKTLRNLLAPYYFKDGVYKWESDKERAALADNFAKIFAQTVYAVNPNDRNDRQSKDAKELAALFPLRTIYAERILGEDGNCCDDPLAALIATFFDANKSEPDSKIADQIAKLRQAATETSQEAERDFNERLNELLEQAVGFGYPNAEELRLLVATNLSFDEQLKNRTRLFYASNDGEETLPSSRNGLGYKNLVKMEFMLAAYAKELQLRGGACVPLLFIEEPESHMHPQLQRAFAEHLENFLETIQNKADAYVQVFLTSHSSHIANTTDFAKIRYAQRTPDGVVYKNLKDFAESKPENTTFIRKYLTLARCDLFFADKIILVEGASERLLLPDMIAKCDKKGLFNSRTYKLPAQYYSIIEVGGAYAHLFVPLLEFLGIPSLILTDVDSISGGAKGSKALVSKGKTTSNATLKYWWRRVKNVSESGKSRKIKLSDILELAPNEKTIGKIHIEFQTEENGLRGRSLEEAMRNVNREFYGVAPNATEKDIEYNGNGKPDFALKLIYERLNYEVPEYIKSGLRWLNDQLVFTEKSKESVVNEQDA